MPHPAVREMETTLMPNHLPLEHIQLDMNQEDYDMRNEDLTPGPGAFTSPPSNCPAGAVQHPQKWSEDQVREWWEKRTKRRPNVEGLSKGTDGRNIMRWNMNRFEQMTKGDSHLAMALYQDLRNEVQRFEHFRKTGVVLKASPIAVPEKRTSKKENFQPPVRREVTEVKAATAPREKRPAVGLKKEPSVKRAVPKAMRRASSNSGTKMTHAVTTKSEGAPERLACARARSSSRPSPERKCKSMQPEPEPEERRTMVMEDLADGALHRLSSPTKREVSIHSARSHKSEPERKAEEVSRRPKSARLKADKEDEEETRQMFDKRELRKRHKDLFEDYVQRWRQRQPETPPNEAEPCRVRVYVRKRPLFGYEQEAEEFDVATAKGRKIVIHNCLTKADLRSLFISHMGFQFAEVFGEWASDEEVYQSTACPAVQHLLQGKVATLFMFGQTGSGKTHTMGGLVQRAAQHIFQQEPTVTLTAFEIAGKVMRDLLDHTHKEKELKIREDKGGNTQVLGLHSLEASSPEQLQRFMTEAQNGRATRATQVNETSSRSHAVFQIRKADSTATLTLVDCAGSERREDTTNHDARSRKDAAEINSSIHALKECFRAMRSAKGQPPYRESLLTRVLSDSFSSDEAMIVAIGTVSPAAKDTEHSIGTLRALQQLQGTQMTLEEREDVLKPKVEVEKESHPKTWSEAEVRQWVEEAAGGRAKQFAASVSKGTDGKNLLRWPAQRFVQLCEGNEDLGSKLYQELRVKMR